jgi:ankyrin repeat protein
MHDTELCNAILLSDESRVKEILDRNASLALSTDEMGRTLLMTAVSMGPQANGVSVAILARLLGAGVDINAQDSEEATAIALAIGENSTDILRFLLDSGADPNLGNPLIFGLWNDGTSAEDLEVLIAAGADPKKQEIDGMNALEWADENGDEDHIRALRRAARQRRKRDA